MVMVVRVKMIMIMLMRVTMMMMKGVVVMKTGCLFAEISFTYVVKNYFDNGHISRDCLRTQQLQGG